MSTDEETLQLVEQVLQGFGLQAERIPKAETRRTPDFFVWDKNHSYLIEVKDKYPDVQELIKRRETLARGEIYERQEPLSHNNNISAVIEDGYNQLKDFNEKSADFRLLWLIARGLNTDVQKRQIQATLYGAVDIIDLADEGAAFKPCFYFFFNDFYRFKDALDGAIITDDRSIKLCLNSLSPRYEGLKQSP